MLGSDHRCEEGKSQSLGRLVLCFLVLHARPESGEQPGSPGGDGMTPERCEPWVGRGDLTGHTRMTAAPKRQASNEYESCAGKVQVHIA